MKSIISTRADWPARIFVWECAAINYTLDCRYRDVEWETIMAKGQMRSNREAKKPKKAPGAEKPKSGAVSAFAKPPGATAKSHKK
jgi:hypothetical protein